MPHIELIAKELNIGVAQVAATARLLSEGGTVPFIARYRKEATGTLDEVAITQIRDRLQQLADLDARRESIVKSLEERNLLTDELKQKIAEAETLARLEDIYQPFRPKRRTRAMIARERGLEPLAQFLLENQNASPDAEAAKFVDAEKEVPDTAAALAGARDIIAEQISDDAEIRTQVRELFEKEGVLKSEVMPTRETEGAKYRDYFEWEEPVRSAPAHRLLAIRRGSQEGFLMFSIRPPEERAVALIEKQVVNGRGGNAAQVRDAVADGYRRLLGPSMETEMRVATKKRADEEAINVFADNIRELLLAAPLGHRRLLAIDPGFRTGCKVVCLDAHGQLLCDTVIYPHNGERQQNEAGMAVKALCERFQVEAVAIGNGTASRETERFVRALGLPASIPVLVVDESGASVYSASEVARDEFPDKDITVRGTVSIGRRLIDPLAELVKIDPKSIGVGQYQHDVDQRRLKASLDDVVTSCVNAVGVEVNTASRQLLSYVAGLSSRLAEGIVKRRQEKGPFRCRAELLDVPGLGPKAFEQSAGFLRIRDAEHPLDRSAVHPERYKLVEKMAADLGCTVEDLMASSQKRAAIRLEDYVSDDVGLPTLKDIVEELAKPGRDPRDSFELFEFAEGVEKIEDLTIGQKLPGIVTNVAAFGAFVDIGVHNDGLVHVSQLSDSFVRNPSEVVKVHQKVQVTVVEIDLERKRIGLSMKSKPDFPGQTKHERSSGGANGPRSGNRRPGGGGGRPPQQNRRGGGDNNGGFGGNWFDDALKKGR